MTEALSNHLYKPDITSSFKFGRFKRKLKNIEFREKWDVWEDAELKFELPTNLSIEGKSVILIDDLYQSGTTIQFIAMKLQEVGLKEVYGLSLVKTLSDFDNK